MQKVKIIKENGLYYIEAVSAVDDIIITRIKITKDDVLRLHGSLTKFIKEIE